MGGVCSPGTGHANLVKAQEGYAEKRGVQSGAWKHWNVLSSGKEGGAAEGDK